MDATEQIDRHAMNLKAHRLLQQILIQLQSVNPNIVEEIYGNISSELRERDDGGK